MFKIKLSDMKKLAYKIDDSWMEDIDPLYLNFDDRDYKNHHNKEIRAKYNDLSDERFFEVEKEAIGRRYEESYWEEYFKSYNNIIHDKIKKDFENIEGFFSSSDEIFYPGELKIVKIDKEKDEIIFEGSHHILASYVINCINGYGMFHYEDLNDFYDCMPCNNEKEQLEAIIGHLHWLNQLENIYGTTYRFFMVDLEDLDHYGTFGDCDYTEENFKEALDFA